MPISNTLAVRDGKVARPATLVINVDGATSFASGSSIGATIATSIGGVPVDASTAEAFTSAETLDSDGFISAFVADMNTKVTGAQVSWGKNNSNEYVVRFRPIPGVADAVVLSLPVFTTP